jgi:hypothetical protein
MLCKQFLQKLEVFKSNLVIDSTTRDGRTTSEFLLLTLLRMIRFRDKDTGTLITDMMPSFEIKPNPRDLVA